MSNKNNRSNFFSGKGYYIALALCAVAIAIGGFVYYSSEKEPETVTVQSTQPPEDVLLEEEFVPALATTEGTEAATPATTVPPRREQDKSTQPTTAPAAQKALKTMAPLKGEEIFGYSMEALSYNQTTRDWRVHNGVDLSAEEGTPVFAAADGVVESAYEDETMGYTVTIRHQGGYVTTYSCLQEGLSVKAGDQVHLGQVIGCVGSTALLETTLGPHLHFAVTCQGQPMDPGEFLELGSK